MATPDRHLDPGQVDALLGEGGWYRSTGLGAGLHYRRGPEHLRVCRRDGTGRVHVDAIDPAEAPVRHLVVDAGPVLGGFVVVGALVGALFSVGRRG